MQVSTSTVTGVYGVTAFEVVQLAPGKFTARQLTYTPHTPLTPEQEAEALESEAQYAAYELLMREQYGDMWDQGPTPESCFTTAEAAQRAFEIHEAMSNAHDDISAFGAGGMGFEERACTPLLRELEELESKFGWREPGSGIYDAEVAHRHVPIRELMPKGTPDSYGDDFVECCC